MEEYSLQNKKAWEFDAYAFWVKTAGTPAERAEKDKKDPLRMLKWHAKYFDSFEGVRVANICGSCGKKAIPLALLGAEVTIFDISEDNKRYALETAAAAGVSIDFEVGDVMEIDLACYANHFDVVFMEGGILHYFHDPDAFMKMMQAILIPGGKLICSDFHPFNKICDALNFQNPTMSYFCTDVFEGEMAHARFYDDEIRKQMPKCSYRKYTVSEIINSIIGAGFTLERFDEQPSWENEKLPGEFCAVAVKKAGNDIHPSFIWDLDGTLLDSYEVIVSGLCSISEEYGVKADRDAISREVITYSVTHYLNSLEAQTGLSYDVVKKRYSELTADENQKIRPMKNAADTLRALKQRGAHNYVYTHRGNSTMEVLRNTGLNEFFDDIITATSGFPRKPDPSAIYHLIGKHGLSKAYTYYVGDRTIDIECAVNAGVKSILFLPEGSYTVPTGKETVIVKDLTEISSLC